MNEKQARELTEVLTTEEKRRLLNYLRLIQDEGQGVRKAGPDTHEGMEA